MSANVTMSSEIVSPCDRAISKLFPVATDVVPMNTKMAVAISSEAQCRAVWIKRVVAAVRRPIAAVVARPTWLLPVVDCSHCLHLVWIDLFDVWLSPAEQLASTSTRRSASEVNKRGDDESAETVSTFVN